MQFQFTNTRVYPFVVNCADALNWKRTFGKLDWLIVREGRMEMSAPLGVKTEKWLEYFYLYAPGYAIRAREVGEATIMEPGEVSMPVHMASGTDKTFYVQVWQNGTTEVPGMCAGTYPDDESCSGFLLPKTLIFYPLCFRVKIFSKYIGNCLHGINAGCIFDLSITQKKKRK